MNPLKLFKTFWGFNGTAREAAEITQAAGFDGMEAPVPEDIEERAAFMALLQETGWITSQKFVQPAVLFPTVWRRQNSIWSIYKPK